MIAVGWSPSVRLFEAGACGTPILSDIWDGIDSLFVPGQEILLAKDSDTVMNALIGADATAIGHAARVRVLAEHTAAHRAAELEAHLEKATAARSPISEMAGAL